MGSEEGAMGSEEGSDGREGERGTTAQKNNENEVKEEEVK